MDIVVPFEIVSTHPLLPIYERSGGQLVQLPKDTVSGNGNLIELISDRTCRDQFYTVLVRDVYDKI